MSNIFSTPWFLSVAAEVLYPDGSARAATVEVRGQRYDTLVLPDDRVASLPLVDFLEPRREPPQGPVVPVPWLPATSQGRIALPPGQPPPPSPARRAAPLVDWAGFPKWEAFVAASRQRDGRTFGKSDRKLRKISRELGPARFALDLQDHALVDQMLLWKGAQLRRAGKLDRFASPRNRQLVHRLVQRGELRVEALLAGDRPLALLLGHRGTQRYSAWITAYDAVFRHLSPGALLFEHLLRRSYEQGQAEFDFLVGAEAYKYHYATHERQIGPLGSAPAAARLADAARGVLHALDDRPDASARARARRLLVTQASARVARQAPTPLADQPAWMAGVLAAQRSWPDPRLLDDGACQLQALLAQSEADLGPVDEAGLWLAHTGRRIQGQLERRLGARAPAGAPSATHATAADPTAAASPAEPRPPLRLAAGERVRVRPVEEIRATLRDGALEGLYFMAGQMEPHAGRVYTVHRPVQRFYDERRQRVVRSGSAVLLEGVRCDGSQVHDARGCDRGCLAFWHEAWLERVDEAPAPAPLAGPRVRVRSAAEIEADLRAHPAGLPWIPATMAPYAGRVLTLSHALRSAYDERRGRVFPVEDGVVLVEATCPGVPLTSGGVCDRGCPLYWRRAWLEPVAQPP